jgi:sialidase-1
MFPTITRQACFPVIIFTMMMSTPRLAQAESYAISPSVPVEQEAAQIISEIVVAKQPKRYIGWPNITRAVNGDLIVVFSGDRDWHVCPWGKIYSVRSTDNGKTWGEPVMIADTPLDDRDASINTMADGSLLLAFGTSLAFDKAENPRYAPYQEHAASLDDAVRKKWLGAWQRQSQDNGLTWGPYISVSTRTPHGPTVLEGGRLLLVRPSVIESLDQGLTWSPIATIEKNPETWKSHNAFLSEQHAVQTADGRIVALSRYNDKDSGDIELRQIESADGGRTWTKPRKTGMRGYPAHLLRLSNGWLLASYGRRIPPMGQRACISKDNGKTWLVDQEIVLSYAAPHSQENRDYPSSWDLGYPSSAQLPDGSIWTVYYQVEKEEDGDYSCLMGTHWRLRLE